MLNVSAQKSPVGGDDRPGPSVREGVGEDAAGDDGEGDGGGQGRVHQRLRRLVRVQPDQQGDLGKDKHLWTFKKKKKEIGRLADFPTNNEEQPKKKKTF